MKTISVVISTYKSEEFIAVCLEELIKQTIFKKLEIIIVDASSPQREKDVVSLYQKQYDNIYYIRLNKRIGIYPAWNIGIQKTKSPYVTAFSTNDRLNPTAYEILSKALDDNPEIDLVYGDTFLSPIPHTPFESGCDIPSMVFKWPEYSYRYLLTNNCIGPHPMWRRRVHTHVGYFDEQYIALGDQEFWLRLGRKFRMLHLPFFSGLFWWTPNSLSGNQCISGKESIKIRKKYVQLFEQDCIRLNQVLQSIQLLIENGRADKAKKLIKKCREDYFYIIE